MEKPRTFNIPTLNSTPFKVSTFILTGVIDTL